MKRILITLLAAVMVLPLAAQTETKNEELKVMSYNIRLGGAKDGTNSWAYRFPATGLMLEDQKPDIFGVQEAMNYQIKFIEENLRDYKSVGVGRDDGKESGEHMSIFWNTKTVKLLKWGTYWLSETPDVPSKGWDADCIRTATWALMKCKKTGNKFYYVNTHLDHKGKEAQAKGLKLVMDRIAVMNKEGYPMVLTGDFNIRPNNPALVELDARMNSARKFAKITDNKATFNGWGKASPDTIIDYIYYSGFSDCLYYETVTKRYADRAYVSDHYPIVAKLVF